MISIKPNQKLGSEKPTKAKVVTALSNFEYCLTAEMTPIGTAIKSVST